MTKITIIGGGVIAGNLYAKLSTQYDINIMPTDPFLDHNWMRDVANLSDLVVLCCSPSKTKAVIAKLNIRMKIIDASYLHRTDDDWVYGLHEYSQDKLIGANRVANAGCIATGALLLTMPLKSVLLGNLLINVTCGTSAGGIELLNRSRLQDFPKEYLKMNVEKGHPHVPEIKKVLEFKDNQSVVIVPKIVSGIDVGMRVEIMLWGMHPYDVSDAYGKAYWNKENIDIIDGVGYIPIDDAKEDKAEIFINPVAGGTLVACLYDNIYYAGINNIIRNIELMLNLNNKGM